jgi:hypothetical protein
MIDAAPIEKKPNSGISVGDARPPPPLWAAYVTCVTLVAITAAHMQLTALFDNVGFSSNSDFYYAKLHPVRAKLRMAAFFAGLCGAVVCLWLFNGYRRADLARAVLLIAAFSALWVFAGIGIVGLSLIFSMLQSSGNLAEAAFVALQIIPAVLVLLTVWRTFRCMGAGHPLSMRLAKMSAALMLLQGFWLMLAGAMLLVIAIAALVSGGTIALCTIMLAGEGDLAKGK